MVSSEVRVVQPRPDPVDAPQEEVGEVQGYPRQKPDVEKEDEVVDPGKMPTSN